MGCWYDVELMDRWIERSVDSLNLLIDAIPPHNNAIN